MKGTIVPKQPDENPSPPIDGLSPKDFLEIVWKTAAGVSLACYLLGFIIVNTHFRRFGYYSVSLVSAQYLIAGVWALVPVALGWFFILYALLRRPGVLARPRSDPMMIVVLILLILGVVGSLILLLQFSAWIEGLPLAPRWIVLIGMGFFLSLPTVAFFWWLNPLSSLTKEWIPLTVLLAFFAGLFALVYLIAFSRGLYEDIPATLGGGKSRLVRLVVKSEAREDLIAGGISFAQGARMSESLRLLIATENEYIVLTRTGDSSISIRSKIVQAVLYEGR
jgi:hypothetical protein